MKKKILKFAGGGNNYYGAEYVPFVQTPTNYQMPTYISKVSFDEPTITAPTLDLDLIEKKLMGAGHTNDVNAYIGTKVAAQREIQTLIAKYGNEAVNIPGFSTKLANLQVNPAEINELLVRKEMSKEYADQNTKAGGQAEWVTDSTGRIFAQDAQTGQTGYYSRAYVATGRVIPITSSDAIKMNDTDNTLVNDKELMAKVAQTWGGDKTFKHVDDRMAFGKTQWLKAVEQLGSVDAVGDAILYGEVGRERGGSSNQANISTLYKSFMDTMDQSALNYFKNQALERVVNAKGRLSLDGTPEELKAREDDYNQAVEVETRKMVWDYMQKALDESSVSRDKVQYNDALTRAKAVGSGSSFDPNPVDFLDFFQQSGSIGDGIDALTEQMVIEGRKKDITWKQNGYRIINPTTGKYELVNTGNYSPKTDNIIERIFQKTNLGLLSIQNLPNTMFAGEPIKITGDSYAFKDGVNMFKYADYRKDNYGNIIPGQFQTAAAATVKVLVHEDQLKGQMGTTRGSDGKYLRGEYLKENTFSGTELSSIGSKIPGITKVGNSSDEINAVLSNMSATPEQKKQILESVERKSGDWYLMDIDVPIGATTAREYGVGARPLMDKMGQQEAGTAQRASLGGNSNNQQAYIWGNTVLQGQ